MGNAAAAGIGRCGVVLSMKTHDHLPVGHLHESRHGIPPGIPVLLVRRSLGSNCADLARWFSNFNCSEPSLPVRPRSVVFFVSSSSSSRRPTGPCSLASARGLPHEARSNVRPIRRGIRRALGSIRPREPNGASPNRDRKHALYFSEEEPLSIVVGAETSRL